MRVLSIPVEHQSFTYFFTSSASLKPIYPISPSVFSSFDEDDKQSTFGNTKDT